MDSSASFGYWLRRRRKALDLTQAALAREVGCAEITIRKIEADELRPSTQVAERLAECLAIPHEERAAFIKAARAELAVDRLALTTQPIGQAPKEGVAPIALPGGTITFLFTDIEGSTTLWEQHPQAMPAALARHDAILRAAIATHGGTIVKGTGDGVLAAFRSAPDALATAIEGQRVLQAEPWGATGPLWVRMALHSGTAEARVGDYFGPGLNRVARLLAAGHGGQVLLSHVTAELLRDQLPAEVELRDLGQHRLKDLARPEQIAQVVTPELPTEFPPLRTLDARRHNLPAQPTALIGRERESAQVGALLRRADVRLATLTGPGGIGKTRLALQVAADMLDEFASGAYFVALAPISDPGLVILTIAQALGVKEIASQPLLESLKDYLREKQVLLLLDNFEQVLAAAPLIADLLTACPKLKALVTSREMLHLYGERDFPVPPLAMPDLAQLPPLDRLTQYEAVRLFIERAQAVKPEFAVTNASAPAVAEICYRLDGLPLAIELAAARITMFPPQALLARLAGANHHSPLRLLTGGARDQPARQQTLRNTIDWSYDLLDAAEKTLFARLGVFAGGCTLEAITAVCNADGAPPMEVTDGVASLMDKSLLRQTGPLEGEARFTMLETIREYALELPAAYGEAEELHARHADYYLALAEAVEPHFRGAEQIVWLKRMEFENDNFRAALAWLHERGAVEGSTAGGAEADLRLAGALFWFWYLHGYWSEGRRWLEGALARTQGLGRTTARAKALFGAGELFFHQGDMTTARARLEESAAIWREVGDKWGLALSLAHAASLGWIAVYERRLREACAIFAEGAALSRELNDQWGLAHALWGLGAAVMRDDYAAARPILEESVALFRDVGDKMGLATALHQLGLVAQCQGDYAQADALCEESLLVCRELDIKGITAMVLCTSGDVAQRQGDYRRAAAFYQEGLALFRQRGRDVQTPTCLVSLAGLANVGGQPQWAARLLSAAETILNTMGLSISVWPITRADYDRYVAAARTVLDDATFAAAWAAGHAMTLEQAIALAENVLLLEQHSSEAS